MIGIQSWAAALPSLRLTSQAIAEAWESCAARGLSSKAVCAFDEDPVTLAANAARVCLDAAPEGAEFTALFLGATALPYEEKPSSSSVLSLIADHRNVRVVEIRGSALAGLQALAAAHDFCAANPGRRALVIATDAPRVHPANTLDHSTGAGAAAFLIGNSQVKISIDTIASVSRETFGSRFRRQGALFRDDLELRINDDHEALKLLKRQVDLEGVGLALGADLALEKSASGLFKTQIVGGRWKEIGDLGAAAAPVALIDALDSAALGARLAVVALGGGAMAITLKVEAAASVPVTLAALAAEGRKIGYLEYLKQTSFLARPERSA